MHLCLGLVYFAAIALPTLHRAAGRRASSVVERTTARRQSGETDPSETSQRSALGIEEESPQRRRSEDLKRKARSNALLSRTLPSEPSKIFCFVPFYRIISVQLPSPFLCVTQYCEVCSFIANVTFLTHYPDLPFFDFFEE